jgi:phenylacetate-CoA ligase
MGRADQTAKVKGMFVHPAQVAAILKRHPEILRGRLVIDNAEGQDRMTLRVEIAADGASNRDAIVESIREVTKLRGDVEIRRPGELPNDGKVIDDTRKYA